MLPSSFFSGSFGTLLAPYSFSNCVFFCCQSKNKQTLHERTWDLAAKVNKLSVALEGRSSLLTLVDFDEVRLQIVQKVHDGGEYSWY